MAGTLRVDVLREPPGPALLADWAALYAQQPEATPFMSPGWAGAWWPHYAGGGQPLIVTVRDDDRLVGLAPLVVRRKGPLRTLEAWGMEPGDYWDVLAGPENRGHVLTAAAEGIRDAKGWDAWILKCLPPGSRLETALDRVGLQSLVHEPILAPAIELPDTFDAYLATLSSNRRSNLRKHLRRLDNGEVVLREVTDPAELPAALERWQGFRRAQWDAQGKEIDPDHLDPRFAAFVADCLRALLPQGKGLLWEFTLPDGKVIGTYVNFADEQSFHWYLGGFDPAVVKLGLGKIAIGHGIRTSIEAGRRRYDFGRGDEAYKYWYGATDRPLPARVVAPPGVRGKAALLAAKAALAVRERRGADDAGEQT